MKIATLLSSLLCFLLLLHHSSPILLPDDALKSRPSFQSTIGRSLLQAKKPCPVNFESKNYTIITSRCRGPNYPADLCCQAFKEFACPYADELSDLTNDCSLVMFSYINRYGDYPPGVFSSLCHGDNVGLVCDSIPPGPAKSGPGGTDDSNDGPIICKLWLQLVITSGLQVLWLL